VMSEKIKEDLLAQKSNEQTISSRLTGWLQQLTESWQAAFAQPTFAAATGGNKSRTVFDWQYRNSALCYSVTEEINGDWYVLLESTEPEMEGKRFTFRLGSFEQELTLEKITDGEFAAEFVILRASRPKDVSELQLKVLE
jgi:hypothetical protein